MPSWKVSIKAAGNNAFGAGGVCQSEDFPAVKKRMARFMAAGFLALGNQH